MKKALTVLLALMVSFMCMYFSSASVVADEAGTAIPHAVKRLRKDYENAKDREKLLLSISGILEHFEGFYYSFYVGKGEVAVWQYELGGRYPRHYAFFDDDVSAEDINDFVTMSILVHNPSLSLGDAEILMSQLVSSYPGNRRSSLIDIGNYDAYLYPSDRSSKPSVVFENRGRAAGVPPVVRTFNHTEMSLEAIRSPSNNLEPVLIRGTVTDQRPSSAIDTSSLVEHITITTEEGELSAAFDFNILPIEFKPDVEYVFYGMCDPYRETDIWIHGVERPK